MLFELMESVAYTIFTPGCCSTKGKRRNDEATTTECGKLPFKMLKVYACSQKGPLAQSAERRADNAKAVGSSPTRTTFFSPFFFHPASAE